MRRSTWPTSRNVGSAASVLGILLLALGLWIPSAQAANRDFNKIETIRIGSLGPVQIVWGIGVHNAVKMAVEEINAAGGILGKKIELFIGDTEGKAEKGITAYKKLVLENKVDVLVGAPASGVSLALQAYLEKDKIVLISTGAASNALTENVKKDYKKYRYFFRNMINADRQQKYASKFLKEFVNGNFGYKKFAILAENAKWTEDYAPNLEKDLTRAGLEVVFNERFDVDMKDFSPVFVKIKSRGAQWIAQILSHAASISLVKAWQDIKPAPMGLCNVMSMDSRFWEITGGACLTEMTYNQIARAPLTDKTIPMWDKYVQKFGTNPVYTSGFSYDIIYMLAEVIKQKKSVKSDDIINGLENISYKCVLHPQTSFDKEKHDILEGRYAMPMIQWQEGGKQVVIWPKESKTGNYVNPSWWKQ